MAEQISSKPWGDITAGDYKDAGALCDACLINQNTGTDRSSWTKANCK